MSDNLITDTDTASVHLDFDETKTTLNPDSNVTVGFDSPKSTPKRASIKQSNYDEPKLYMSNDFYTNSVLLSNTYSLPDPEERVNSLKVLGRPRCWTDSLLNSDGEDSSAEKNDSDSWTMMTPVRKLDITSRRRTSKEELADYDDFNPEDSENLTLVDLFKHLCVAAKRVVLRGGVLLFEPVSRLIQRMTKHSFTLTEIRQFLYLCPEVISVRWVKINATIAKLYPKEYCLHPNTTLYDLKISLKVNGTNCTTSSDFNKAISIFTEAYQRYITVNDKTDSPPSPISPLKPSFSYERSGDYSLSEGVERGDSPSVPLMDLPDKPSPNRSKLLDVLKTPTKPYKSEHPHDDHTPSRFSSSSRLSSLRAAFDRQVLDPKILSENTSSFLSLESPYSDINTDLLETPGMKRIKLAAMQREMANKDTGGSATFHMDKKWLIEVLYEMIVNEQISRVISISSLYKFICARCHSNIDVKRLTTILKQIEEDHPNTLKLTSSCIDGHEMLSIDEDCMSNPNILQNLINI